MLKTSPATPKEAVAMTFPLSDEWLCQKIVAESNDAIIFADRQGFIRLWNRGAEEIFGYPAAAALGQSLGG